MISLVRVTFFRKQIIDEIKLKSMVILPSNYVSLFNKVEEAKANPFE